MSINSAVKVFFAIFLLTSAGCATMNESECRNADWRIIGMEDGAHGRNLSHIGQHRSACAKHNVTPDLTTYQEGHAEGVKQYCTGLKGFWAGKSGRRYNGACPPELEGLFLEGYQVGRELYGVNQKIKKLTQAIKSRYQQINQINEEISAKEQLMISNKVSVLQRAQLLIEIKDLGIAVGELEAETVEYQELKAIEVANAQDLKRMYVQ